MIAIIEYNAGNITSVARALHSIGQDFVITDDTKMLNAASHAIFPGVGAAGEAMAYLKDKKLDVWLKQCFRSGKPILGICLGTQIILDASEENDAACIGLVGGTTRRFPESLTAAGRALKIPHMGWNSVAFRRPHPVFAGVPEEAEYYFVHSYYPSPESEEAVLGTTEYGMTFCSVLAVRNLIAMQFHPEKSGRPGLQILKNFCAWEGK
ncbi:MAG: imidazole glycerol phosphate synthase subunit HisH [Smithellaceae bacterium]|jgi:imidazole glycerol-phosphate synthase subunit HisH|nr:imidazole glycerol phosphate synthase subunit HisH [Smithellaceae bacterium]HPN87609.1 imidazole glycerol phosphate synthase subunit HisH [Smithella sp.]MDD3849972.1 imidazole glycerol phosphate synthase subunit HisH [Smithellaceae bacterium]HOG12203.1 imidazole glycerol phosphate synthase subunit HisH [Smithellaceae bacterium]HOQ72118.1 imidazole glycerol phosphate synthase subunit HisH [Smithellaceae bacterium]